MSTPIDQKHPETREFSRARVNQAHRMVEFRGGSLHGSHMLNTCYSGYLEQYLRNGSEVYRLHSETQENPSGRFGGDVYLFYQLERSE